MLYLQNPGRLRKHIIAIPVVSTLIIPVVISDIRLELYHRICFPLYGLPYVKRGNYIKIDRHQLPYLNLIQKAYCIYCGYGSGLSQYRAKIISETERYRCGIQHKQTKDFVAPPVHKDFPVYGDKKCFVDKYKLK